ncbi:uncharacterized protein [Cherax quadricarinatus]|uniref:uncharacterized protein n=1 Tax=Cherax quadricarinatus TaxID=27406 RepID=UPI0023797761|nr:uncharacterized protein LOC128700261 [Cherax quadricarinatus]
MKQCGYLILTATLLVLFVGGATAQNFPFASCFNATTLANIKAEICADLNLTSTACKSQEGKIAKCSTSVIQASAGAAADCMKSQAGFTVPPLLKSTPVAAMTAAIIKQPTLCAKVPAVMECFEAKTKMPQKVSACLKQ